MNSSDPGWNEYVERRMRKKLTVHHVCPQCGKEFWADKKKRKFCSIPCVNRAAHLSRLQTPETIEKRKRWGSDHHAWKGDAVADQTARARAGRMYKNIGPCERCGTRPTLRHHKDENPRNNAHDNIEILCRPCHYVEHQRLWELTTSTPGIWNAKRGIGGSR